MPYKTMNSYTEVVLSGTDSPIQLDACLASPFLEAQVGHFPYILNKGTAWYTARTKKYISNNNTFIDSGSLEFISEGFCTKWGDMQWFEDYVVAYSTFITKFKRTIRMVQNMPIGALVGQPKVDHWDNTVFSKLEKQGIEVCYMWVAVDTLDSWIGMCRKHKNVGIYADKDTITPDKLAKLLSIAQENMTRVHVWGTMHDANLIQGGISTYITPITQGSGVIDVFDKGYLTQVTKQDTKILLSKELLFTSHGIDADLLMGGNAVEGIKACALGKGLFAEFLREETKSKAYWTTVQEHIQRVVGDLVSVQPEAIIELLDERGIGLPETSAAGYKGYIEDILSIVNRDEQALDSFTDEDISWWVEQLKASPENNSREELLFTVRQELLFYFSEYTQAGYSMREEGDVTPSPKERTDKLPRYTAETVQLPDVDSNLSDKGVFLSSTEDNNQNITHVKTSNNVQGDTSKTNDLDYLEQAQRYVDDTVSDIADNRTERNNALLLVDLLFTQLKLKAQAEELRSRKKNIRKSRELKSKAASMSGEITACAGKMGKVLHTWCEDQANVILKAWHSAGKLEESLPVNKTRRGCNLTSERAREIGKKGGAPKGNQNARKHGLTSTKMPTLACDNCHLVANCPQYRAGHVCAFTSEFHAPVECEGESPQITVVKMMLGKQVERMRVALLYETLEGGRVSDEVNKVMATTLKAAELLETMQTRQVCQERKQAQDEQNAPRKGGFLGSILGDLKDVTSE